MRTILIGNGIDIQYGGSDYLCNNIVNRAITNVKTGKFREIDYPSDIIDHLNDLFALSKQILNEPTFIKKKVWTSEDGIALESFCSHYNKTLSDPSQIGFEDYFLIQRLYFNLTYNSKVGNYTERNNYYDYLRRFFLDAIYNNGEICKISYPKKFGTFLENFDHIFTLNYNRNIEKITNKHINYLHGAYHILSEKYNNESPMNKVMDLHTDITNYEYLYSTALTTYCGKEKEALLKQADSVNGFLKLSSKLKEICDRDKVYIPSHLKTIIEANEICSNYNYPQNYCYDLFEQINDQVVILGLSPFNDDHLIRVINNNIHHITYYFYPHKKIYSEKKLVREIFNKKKITFKNVAKLWASFS